LQLDLDGKALWQPALLCLVNVVAAMYCGMKNNDRRSDQKAQLGYDSR